MKKNIVFIALFSYSLSMSGCMTANQAGEPDAGRSATSGAVLGGIIGGIIGGATGDGKVKNIALGTAIGGLVGGSIGYIYGKEREKKYKSARQIYTEKPRLARRSSASMPPRITGMVPIVRDEQDRPLKKMTGGQKVWLGTRYQIEIPKYSNVREVEVVEINTLTAPNGVTTDERRMTRVKRRACGGVDAAIQLTIPKNAPEGKYVHHALVKINGRKYERNSEIQMVKIDGEMHFYALN